MFMLFLFSCSHTVEMTKLKEIHAAAEKLRREKWIDEKTKKIKAGHLDRPLKCMYLQALNMYVSMYSLTFQVRVAADNSDLGCCVP